MSRRTDDLEDSRALRRLWHWNVVVAILLALVIAINVAARVSSAEPAATIGAHGRAPAIEAILATQKD